jgi:hypothetical protein
MSRELVGRFMALALPEGATRDHPVNRFMALALKRKEVN